MDGRWTGEPYPSYTRTIVRPYPYYGTVRTPTRSTKSWARRTPNRTIGPVLPKPRTLASLRVMPITIEGKVGSRAEVNQLVIETEIDTDVREHKAP